MKLKSNGKSSEEPFNIKTKPIEDSCNCIFNGPATFGVINALQLLTCLALKLF